MKLSKTTYLHTFTFIVLALGVVKLINKVSGNSSENATADTISLDKTYCENVPMSENDAKTEQIFDSGKSADNRIPHPIRSVYKYEDAFPDANDIQLAAATKYGVSPVSDEKEAESRKNELVYVSSNPWFHVDKLKSSSPYLVPRAAKLLQNIGRVFLDSLDVKAIPLHKIIATSVLRTRENVAKLKTRNLNATENSCHLYGTTFDICYNRYETVEDPNGPPRRQVTNDTLKWVLSEVLRDFRQSGQCYVKYERKQGCFHITTR